MRAFSGNTRGLSLIAFALWGISTGCVRSTEVVPSEWNFSIVCRILFSLQITRSIPCDNFHAGYCSGPRKPFSEVTGFCFEVSSPLSAELFLPPCLCLYQTPKPAAFLSVQSFGIEKEIQN